MNPRPLLFAAIIWSASSSAEAQTASAQGEVVAATGMECSNYFAVKTDDGYALLEWYGGPMPEKADKVTGDFTHFGYQDITVQLGGAKFRAYIADYGLSLDDANDKLKDKCN
jgi:hypothetical protein